MGKILSKNQTWLAPVAGLLTNRFVGEGKPVDIKAGLDLLRDRRIPVAAKLLSLIAGIAFIALLEVLELPAEMLLNLLLPVIGLGITIAVDGLEYIVGSVLLAAALLPYIAPKEIVSRIRAERSGPVPVTVTSGR
jgi:hypothetical protein